jgi:hypothetical protein
MRCYALGDPIDMQETRQVFSVPLISVLEYTRQVLIPA